MSWHASMNENGCTFITGFGLGIGNKLVALLHGLAFMLVMIWLVQIRHCSKMEVNGQLKLQRFKVRQ